MALARVEGVLKVERVFDAFFFLRLCVFLEITDERNVLVQIEVHSIHLYPVCDKLLHRH